MMFLNLLSVNQIKKIKMKKSNPLWILALSVVFILIILNIVMSMKISEYEEKVNHSDTNLQENFSFKGKSETGEECPDAKGGLENAFLQVKYFYSSFCPWCAREEPILQKLVKNYGNLIHIKWYNINNCPDSVEKYKVNGVPTFVFSTTTNQTEYSHYGFIYEKDLMKLLCNITGGC